MAKNLVEKVGEIGVDILFNDGNVSVSEKSVKIKKGGIFARGTVLGINSTTGYAVAVDSSKNDGTEVADCILADDINATLGDEKAVAYTKGQFNRQALLFGGSDKVDKHESTLRQKGIFLKDNYA